MTKSVHNDMLDAALNYIKTYGDRMIACSAAPTTFTEANVDYALADVTLDSDDYTVADDTSGRKVTIAAQSTVTIDADGDATHVAIVDVSESKLIYVTSCTLTSLTSGNTCDFTEWEINILDPS